MTSNGEAAELEDLKTQLRRAELRLAGCREQLSRRLNENAGASQDQELLARAEAAEAELRALLNTRTMRLLRRPRAAYASLRSRIADQ